MNRSLLLAVVSLLVLAPRSWGWGGVLCQPNNQQPTIVSCPDSLSWKGDYEKFGGFQISHLPIVQCLGTCTFGGALPVTCDAGFEPAPGSATSSLDCSYQTDNPREQVTAEVSIGNVKTEADLRQLCEIALKAKCDLKIRTARLVKGADEKLACCQRKGPMSPPPKPPVVPGPGPSVPPSPPTSYPPSPIPPTLIPPTPTIPTPSPTPTPVKGPIPGPRPSPAPHPILWK